MFTFSSKHIKNNERIISMRTEKIGIQNQTSFGQLKIKKGAGLTDKIAEAIEASPAMKKFGRRYNADVLGLFCHIKIMRLLQS